MIKLLLIAVVLTCATVFIHGIGSMPATARILRTWQATKHRPGPLQAEFLLARVVTFLLLLHLIEMSLWAAYYFLDGLLPDFHTATYFSLTSYTTVGYGDVLLPGPSRLLGPIEATVGILMLGWSTGIIVAVLMQVYRDRFAAVAPPGDPPKV